MNFWMTMQSREFLKVDELIAAIRAGKITEDRLSVTRNYTQVKAGDAGFMIAKQKGDYPCAVYATYEVLEEAGELMLDPHPEFLVNPKADTKERRALIRYDSCYLPIPVGRLERVKPSELNMSGGPRKMRAVGKDLFERVRAEIARWESPPPRKD